MNSSPTSVAPVEMKPWEPEGRPRLNHRVVPFEFRNIDGQNLESFIRRRQQLVSVEISSYTKECE